MNMESEIICGYLVTAKQKRINAVYLDLLQEFDRLCRKAGLTYWVFFGALIGAVRHKGFIPWDDDVDILLPRQDFDRLRKMTSEQFGAKAPYFLQSPLTDPAYNETLLRFRRSDTTALMWHDREALRSRPERATYNMGLNLSIFPLTNYSENPAIRKMQPWLASAVECVEHRALCSDGEKPFRHKLARAIIDGAGYGNVIKFKHWLYHGDPTGKKVQCFNGLYPEPCMWNAEDFQETVMLPFEDIQIPAPAGYDRILSDTYGDYMQFPPEEKRSPPHDAYMDPDTPYTVSIQKLLASASDNEFLNL